MSHHHTTVAEEGNRRRGGASAEEIEQCILDIKSWFERHTPLKTFETASSVDFQRTEKLIDATIPRSLKSVLSEINGGIWLMEKQLMSLEKIAETIGNMQSSSLWRGSLVPFAGDESAMLVLNNSGEVCEWDSDDGLGDCVGATLSAYLENYRDQLLEGHCEFLRDVGVVEKVASKPRK